MGDFWREEDPARFEVLKGAQLPRGRCLIPSFREVHKSNGEPPVGNSAVNSRNYIAQCCCGCHGGSERVEDLGMTILGGLEMTDGS